MVYLAIVVASFALLIGMVAIVAAAVAIARIADLRAERDESQRLVALSKVWGCARDSNADDVQDAVRRAVLEQLNAEKAQAAP